LNELILYLSPIPWDHVRQRPQHIADRLASKRNVIFVSNPTSNDKWLSIGVLKLVAPRLYELHPPKIGSTSKTGSYLAQPRVGFGREMIKGIIALSRFLNSLNYVVAGLYIRLLISRLKHRRVIIWVSSPAYLLCIPFLGRRNLIVYDRLDDFGNMPGYGKETKLWDLIMTMKADIVFSSSEKLHAFARSHNGNAVLLKNGVEYYHFDLDQKNKMMPPTDILAIPKPRIGFIGVVGDWIDLSLIKKMAIDHSEWNFVFIGPVEASLHIMSNLKNVYFLGKKPYELLPRYLQNMDACILPFKVNNMTNSVNPVKLYEYLAAGKPIVSTRIREANCLQKFVTIADTAEQFSKAIGEILQHPNPTRIQQGKDFAASNDWNCRVSFVETLLASY